MGKLDLANSTEICASSKNTCNENMEDIIKVYLYMKRTRQQRDEYITCIVIIC